MGMFVPFVTLVSCKESRAPDKEPYHVDEESLHFYAYTNRSRHLSLNICIFISFSPLIFFHIDLNSLALESSKDVACCNGFAIDMCSTLHLAQQLLQIVG